VRAIRGVVSIACLLACIGFAALWVRSHYERDDMYWRGSGQYVALMSWNGQVAYAVRIYPPVTYAPPTLRSTTRPAELRVSSHIDRFLWNAEERSILGFGMSRTTPDIDASRLTVPHWFLVIVSGALAVLLKPKPRLQFSVRDLLVVMAMVAVAVAALAALPKS
jgi:hypothetical protein